MIRSREERKRGQAADKAANADRIYLPGEMEWEKYDAALRSGRLQLTDAMVENSMLSEGGNIYGNVDFSVLFAGVTIEEGAEIRDSIRHLLPAVLSTTAK